MHSTSLRRCPIGMATSIRVDDRGDTTLTPGPINSASSCTRPTVGYPDLRYEQEEPFREIYRHATREQILKLIDADGFFPLQSYFDEVCRPALADAFDKDDRGDLAEGLRSGAISLENFVDQMTGEHQYDDPFEGMKAEFPEASESVHRGKPIHWKETLDDLMYCLNFVSEMMSAEDHQRFHKVIEPFLVNVIAAMPLQSAKTLLALHDAGKLEVVAGMVEVKDKRDGEIVIEVNDDGELTEHRYRMFVDCSGQEPVTIETYPFPSLVESGGVTRATAAYRDESISPEELPGIAIDSSYRVIDRDGQPSERIYDIAMPHVAGCRPYSYGLQACNETASIVVEHFAERPEPTIANRSRGFPPPSKMKSINKLRSRLADHFGFCEFRPGQHDACQSAIEGRDTLVLMPTGSGKSLCYQLPGLELEGVTVVVSPLISLAEDQAAHIRELGTHAAILNSSKTATQIRQFRDDIKSGKAEFVFTTPERLQQSDICELLAEVGVDMFVIDEAHCASQWGHDFRPDYLCLHHARQRLGNPPVLAMTATASPKTVDEIVRCLKLSDPKIVATGIHRENLRLSVIRCEGREEKTKQLRKLFSSQTELEKNQPGIVYCATTRTCEILRDTFSDVPIPTLCYHGRMNKAARMEAQSAFMDGPPSIMFATNAFGLGIDKPDTRRVVHYDLPGSLEAYYQEAGRAGRDGELAACTLLYDPDDVSIQKMFAGGLLDSSQLMTAHHTLVAGIGRWPSDDHTVSLADLSKISPLGRQALKQCLQQLASRGITAPPVAGDGRACSMTSITELPTPSPPTQRCEAKIAASRWTRSFGMRSRGSAVGRY